MITVDITTRNTVFYPLGPQGQWIQHRFGKRNYPIIDLDLSTIEKIVSTNDTVFFRSIYGDPLCHPDINQILDTISVSSTNVFFFSFLNVSKKIINKVNNIPNIHIYGLVDGFNTYGKTILDSNKRCVFSNIKALKNITLEYRMYKHNILDIQKIKEHFPNVNITTLPGIKLIADFANVVDKNGNWLYDVFYLDDVDESKYNPALNKTIDGYKVLTTYLAGPDSGVSILDKPPLAKHIRTNKIFADDMKAVSVTGHIFNSTELLTIFSNALCNDWKITSNMNQFEVEVNTGLLKILEDELKSFSDSNI